MTSSTDYAVPTGEYVEEWLDEHDMTRAELARRTGVSRKHITTVIAGAPVTPDFAMRLELVTGVPAQRWLALEAQYRADLERLGLIHSLAADAELLARFGQSFTYLRHHGIVSGTMRRPGELVMELMAFFGVGSPDALVPGNLIPQVSFHQSHAFTAEDASLATWLRMAGHVAREQPLQRAYDPVALTEALPEIRSLSRTLQDAPFSFVERLERVGVKVVVQPEVRGCRAYGATFWEADRPIIVVSTRGKTDGSLWFTLFHEICHVLRHPHGTYVEGAEHTASNDQREEEANLFAEDQLIPVEARVRFALLRTDRELASFAEAEEISPGVVVHLLHFHEHWPYSRGRHHYARLTAAEQ